MSTGNARVMSRGCQLKIPPVSLVRRLTCTRKCQYFEPHFNNSANMVLRQSWCRWMPEGVTWRTRFGVKATPPKYSRTHTATRMKVRSCKILQEQVSNTHSRGVHRNIIWSPGHHPLQSADLSTYVSDTEKEHSKLELFINALM